MGMAKDTIVVVDLGMATIQINGDWCTVTLSEADEEAHYTWTASCGAASEGAGGLPSVGDLGDAINDAIIHADIRCERSQEGK